MARTARAFIVRPDPNGFATVTTRLRDWLEAAGPDGAAIYEHPYERRRQAAATRPAGPAAGGDMRLAQPHPLADAVASRPQTGRAPGREVIDLVWCGTRGVWRSAEAPVSDTAAASC